MLCVCFRSNGCKSFGCHAKYFVWWTQCIRLTWIKFIHYPPYTHSFSRPIQYYMVHFLLLPFLSFIKNVITNILQFLFFSMYSFCPRLTNGWITFEGWRRPFVLNELRLMFVTTSPLRFFLHLFHMDFVRSKRNRCI